MVLRQFFRALRGGGKRLSDLLLEAWLRQELHSRGGCAALGADAVDEGSELHSAFAQELRGSEHRLLGEQSRDRGFESERDAAFHHRLLHVGEIGGTRSRKRGDRVKILFLQDDRRARAAEDLLDFGVMRGDRAHAGLRAKREVRHHADKLRLRAERRLQLRERLARDDRDENLSLLQQRLHLGRDRVDILGTHREEDELALFRDLLHVRDDFDAVLRGQFLRTRLDLLGHDDVSLVLDRGEDSLRHFASSEKSDFHG